jgi:lysophospholipase L1-like esterase
MHSVALWILLVISVLSVSVSSVLCMVLYRYTVRRYQIEQQVRMDPTGSALFIPKNAKLLATKSGQSRVVLFGDSRIAMWSPPLQVDGAQIVNRGWGGETTGQALLRLDRDVIGLRPRIALIEFGMNDLKAIGLFPEREEAIIEDCIRNLKSIVKQLRDEDITVVLLTVFPNGPVSLMRRPIWSDRIPSAIARVNRSLLELASQCVVVIDCDPTLANDGRMRLPYALDVFHLTSRGYRELNALLEPRLHSLLLDVAPR